MHRNVALVVEAPTPEEVEIRPLTVDEARALLAAADGFRLGIRWIIGLSLGLRQGEALGLWWEDVDLAAGVIRVRRQLLRPDRKGAPLTFGPLTSARSRRTLAVRGRLADLLAEHRDRQALEHDRASERWADSRLVFATATGRPINHRNDAREFKALCERAGIPPYRVHDLRHTAATLLIAQGQHRVVMEVMGHSQIAVTMNIYGHVMDPQLKEAADVVDGALWGNPADGHDDTDSDDEEG